MITIWAESIEANECVLCVKMTKYHTEQQENYVAIVGKHTFNCHTEYRIHEWSIIFRNELTSLIETACFYRNFINSLHDSNSSSAVFQGLDSKCCLMFNMFICPGLLLTSADVRRLPPDHVGAGEAAQAVQVPEEEEQGDELRPEAHHGDLQHEERGY